MEPFEGDDAAGEQVLAVGCLDGGAVDLADEGAGRLAGVTGEPADPLGDRGHLTGGVGQSVLLAEVVPVGADSPHLRVDERPEVDESVIVFTDALPTAGRDVLVLVGVEEVRVQFTGEEPGEHAALGDGVEHVLPRELAAHEHGDAVLGLVAGRDVNAAARPR